MKESPMFQKTILFAISSALLATIAGCAADTQPEEREPVVVHLDHEPELSPDAIKECDASYCCITTTTKYTTTIYCYPATTTKSQ